MAIGRFSSFIKDENAGATVEFIAVMGPYVLITFFIVEVIIAVLWIGTAEKAAQLGARLAVVSDAAATGVPSFNAKTASGGFGVNCSDASAPCSASANPWSYACTGGTGGSCNATAFNNIVKRIRNISSLIQ